MEIIVEISPGELTDKITILEIKSERIQDPKKLSLIKTELGLLSGVYEKELPPSHKLQHLKEELKRVNEALWAIEDDIRSCEKEKKFGNRFIELARSVYITNDQRSEVKNMINQLFSSKIHEVKSYEDYS